MNSVHVCVYGLFAANKKDIDMESISDSRDELRNSNK